MLLAVDVGNTNTTLGVFQGDRLRATWRLFTEINRLPDEYGATILTLLRTEGIEPAELREAVVGSVVPSLTPVFGEACWRYFGVRPFVVEAGVRTGLRILYDSPREVGADRVVDAVAALRLYQPPLVIVDFGTATVFDAISAEGDYVGGAIAPGIGIATEALYEKTSLLRRVQLEPPRTAIGKNTVHAMQSGIVFGYAGLVEGIVRRFQEELGGTVTVVATGGWADTVARETPCIDVVNKDLTLIGLRIILELNREGREG